MVRVPLLIAALVGAAVLPAAADPTSSVGLGVQAGSIGIGPVGTIELGDQLELHVINGTYRTNVTVNSDQAYNATVRVGGTAGWLDYRTSKHGALRLSLGLLQNAANVHVVATPNTTTTTTVVVNGATYTVSGNGGIGNVIGDIRFNGTAPYVGFGLGPTTRRPGLAFIGSAGIALGPPPQTSLYATNPGALDASGQATLASNLASERAQVQSKVNFLQTYPVVSLGLQYRF